MGLISALGTRAPGHLIRMDSANFSKLVDKTPVVCHQWIPVDTLNKAEFDAYFRRCAVELARHGVSALDRLYDVTSVRLLRYTLTITRSREDAEDAIQAAMVRIALKPRALASANHPWPYLVRVARNEALKIVQRRKPTTFLSRVLEPAVPVETQLDADSRQFVRQALRRLPSAQAEVVVLKVWEEMTFAEIAAVLDLSPNTVASRYRYALQKLTEQLEPLRY